MTDFAADSTTAFDVLGHEDRIRILEALVQRRAANPAAPSVGFSDLRRETGVADSGRFNYHLEKLVGRYVRETDGGYRLTAAGSAVVGAILSGSFETEGEWGPVELSAPCRECGSTTEVVYEDGKIRVECPDGHLNHRDQVPRSIAERLSLPDAMGLATQLGLQDLELLLQDLCPRCYGPVRSALEEVEGEDIPAFSAGCDRCGHYLDGPPGLAVLPHPVLQAFYLERDRDVRTAPLWTLPFLIEPDRWTLESVDPVRLEIDASLDDRELTFLLDDECTVLEYAVDWV